MWEIGSVDQVRQDLRHSVRRLVKRPRFSVAVVGVIALGIGTTTAIFSIVDAVLLRPLPFHEPQRLVALRGIQIPFREEPEDNVAIDIVDLGESKDVFSHVAAYASGGLNFADPERPKRVSVGVVTTDFFATLGARPVRGRTFGPHDGSPDSPSVAILSHAMWTGHFGQSDVIGRQLQLGSRSYEVIGVMPRGFAFPAESDVWIPMPIPTTRATFEPFRGSLPAHVLARLAQGVSANTAEGRLRARWRQLEAESPPAPGRMTALQRVIEDIDKHGALTPLRNALVGDHRSALLVLLGATGLLLIIACANVTNLLLAHAVTRRREIALREVLGATRSRLVRQFLTESLVLSVTGAALGVALAPVAFEAMAASMPAALAGVAPPRMDWRVLGFATALALLTGVGFGLWPALTSTRDTPMKTIKAGGGVGMMASSSIGARRILMVTEIALTLMLLVGAGLMLRSFERLMSLDAGWHETQVGTVELAFSRGTPMPARLGKISEILERLSASPEIQTAGAVNDLPLGGPGGMSISVDIEGVEPAKGAGMRMARYLVASGDYFSTLGIPIIRGRSFEFSDDSLAPRVAIVSASMARRYWAGVDPLGRTFRLPMPGAPPITVVGIAADVRDASLENDPTPQMYFPIYAETPDRVTIVARSTLSSEALLARMVEAVRIVDRTQAVYNVRMMGDVIGSSVATRRTNTLFIAGFATLALLLASVGLFAVISNAVAQQSRELGIRAALGATPANLAGLVSREVLWIVGAGLVIGAAGAWALAQAMTSLLYGIDPHDLTTFTIVPVVLATTAALATAGPVWRARRVDLMEVLRAE